MKRKFNFYLGAAASAWLLAILVIVAELAAPFKTLLQTLFGHHWIGKAVIVALVFVAAGFLVKEKKPHEKLAWYSAVGSMAVIFLFYVIEFLV